MRVATAEVGIRPDFSGFKESLRAGVRAATTGVNAEIKVDADTANAVRQIKAAARDQRVEITVDADHSSLGRFTRALGLAGKEGNAFKDVIRTIQFAGMAAGALGAAASLVGLAGAATSLVSALAAAGAAAIALPGILAAIGQGAGVGFLATVGLKDAFTAMGAASSAAGKSAASTAAQEMSAASTIRSAKNSVRDATIAVSRATQDAAYANEQAARRVTDAERNVASVRKDVAQQIIDAGRRVADAERSLADAQRDARRAQEDLNQARRDAADDLIDLDHELDRAKLANERAVLDLERAKQRLEEVRRDPGASALDRKEAELAYREQKQRWDDTMTNLEQVRDQEEKASKAGIEGSKQVKDAKEKIADANRKVAEEARGVAEAERDAARVRVEGSAKIADAVREVADAEKAAARQRREASQSVADAQRRLTDAQISLTEAQKRATASTGQQSAATSKLNEAMAALAPAGQKFVRFLYDQVRPAFLSLVHISQTNILGPLQTAMQRVGQVYAPMVRDAVDATSKALGGLIAKGAALAASGPFSASLGALMRNNVGIIKSLGDAGLNLADAFVTISEAAIPLTNHLVSLVLKGTDRLNQSIKDAKASGGLADFFDNARAALDRFLILVGNVGRIIGGIFKAAFPAGLGLLGTLGQLTDKMADFVNSARGQDKLKAFFDNARDFVTGVLDAVASLAPLMGRIVGGLGSLAGAAGRFASSQPAIAGIALSLGGIAGLGSKLGLGSLVPNLARLALLNPAVAAVGLAIAGIGVAGFLAYTKVKPFREAVDGLAKAVGSVLSPVLTTLRNVIRDQVIPSIQKALPFVRDQLVAGIKSLTKAVQDNKPQLVALGNLLVTVGGWIASKVIPFLVQLWSVQLRALIEFLGGTIRIIGQVVSYFQTFWKALGTTISNVKGFVSSARAQFDDLRKGAGDKVNAIVQFFRDLPGRAKAGFLAAAGGLVSAVAGKFAEIKDKAKAPLNGLIDLINKFLGLIGKLHLPGLSFPSIGHLNAGGPVTESFSGGSFNKGGRIPGGGPNRDSVPAMLTPGEYVIQRPAVKALGTAFLDAVNQSHTLDVGGDPGGVRLNRGRFSDPGRQGVQLVNQGGWILNPVYRAAGGGIPTVQQWIRAQDSHPYIWGGTGPKGFDCSGITGAAYGRLTGRGGGSGQRYFTTSSNFASLGFKRGTGTYTIGVNPGHHMAGNLAGLGFEARSTKTGIFVGGSAKSVGSFAQQWYLPQIGSNFVSAGGGGGGGGGGGIAAGIARAALNAILGPIRSGVNGLGGSGIGGTIAKAIGNKALDALVSAIEDRVGVFHDGGYVTHDQLAYLQRGEQVLSAAQVRARGGDGAAMGGLTIAVDARGSHDPAAVEAAARRGAQAGAAAVLTTYRQARTARPRR